MKEVTECSVLLVDDVEANIDALRAALGDDYDLRVALDGETALELVRSDPPDLILLDVVMPGMDGFEVIRRLKAEETSRRIPVIFITGRDDVADETLGLELGAVDYITKPFNAGVVRARVRTQLFLQLAQIALEELLSKEKIERDILMKLFSCHVSRAVAETVWANKEQFLSGGRLKPTEMTVTVMFSDLKGFTSISEQMKPQALLDWLNEYMEAMAELVIDHHGLVKQYSGDEIMALFGAPMIRMTEYEKSQDALNAVNCALAMGAKLEELNTGWKKAGKPQGSMRIGIFTGPVVGGSIGDEQRLDYQVIGDTVNTASRLESFDKDFDRHNPCRILIGRPTLDYLGGRFRTEQLGMISLKGKEHKVVVHQVLGPAPEFEEAS